MSGRPPGPYRPHPRDNISSHPVGVHHPVGAGAAWCGVGAFMAARVDLWKPSGETLSPPQPQSTAF